MAEDNPYQHLAQQFLDLWEKQLSATMKDPELVGSMVTTMRTMQANVEKAYESLQTTATGASATHAGDDELDELHRRLKQCEERIAELESESKGAGKGT